MSRFSLWICPIAGPPLTGTNNRKHQRERQYLVGTFSLADIAYAPLVCELEACRLGHLLTDRPAVGAWVERLRARPSIRATTPIVRA